MKNRDNEYLDQDNPGKYHEEYLRRKKEKKMRNIFRSKNIDWTEYTDFEEDLYDLDAYENSR
jgi:hypothetical protein